MKLSVLAVWAVGLVAAVAGRLAPSSGMIRPLDPRAAKPLQDIVTWDDKSFFVRGERIMIFGGEFHPFRLPVPSLWLDVLQKIKALGLNTVSFYVDWALLEGKRGRYLAEGALALEPFFEAAKKAGVYLIARPGPYINAEVAGGGYPGWITRINGTLRTSDRGYLEATDNYIANVAKTIAAAQITNGGPVILYQPENEYTSSIGGRPFPDGGYMQYVMDQARNAGIVVPMISNDAFAGGHNAPGSGVGAVDIYGHDSYFWGPDDCERPDNWRNHDFSWGSRHMNQSPTTPFSVVEYQAGCWSPWGGASYDECGSMTNGEFASIFFKTPLGLGVKLMGMYMLAGGTNWGNLAFPDGYSSYDYAASVREDRRVDRAKYSEVKLIANFVRASTPALAAAGTVGNGTAAVVDMQGDALEVGRVAAAPGAAGKGTPGTQFLVVRHRDVSVQATTTYKLNVTRMNSDGGSGAQLRIPRQGGSLSLIGRDAKIHTVDYDAGGIRVAYCTAEILAWKKVQGRVVLLVYGGVGERHEIGIDAGDVGDNGTDGVFASDGITSFNWEVASTEKREIIKLGPLDVILLTREQAHEFWVIDVTDSTRPEPYASSTSETVIVKGGYLVRSASMSGSTLHIQADFDETTTMEIIGAPEAATALSINGNNTVFSRDPSSGFWKTTVLHWAPILTLPTIGLDNQTWQYVDSLPEVKRAYDDSKWVKADLKVSPNIAFPITTPTSLYAADYGFHTGYLLFRGSFVANGSETGVRIQTQGGEAFASAVWMDETYLGSWPGQYPVSTVNIAYNFTAPLVAGTRHVVTVLIDNHGHEMNLWGGGDGMKRPRGIINYEFQQPAGPVPAASAPVVDWAVTGNLGGEDYADLARGPLNEGGLYAERQGWHLPSPPDTNASAGWTARSPVSQGIAGPGVGFFTTKFALDMPRGFDVPLYLTIANSSSGGHWPPDTATDGPAANYYRAQLYVNGWQFAKYISHMGPQSSFYVPEGILNYRGDNWLAVSLWALQPHGARLAGLELGIAPGAAKERLVMSGYEREVELVESPVWKLREGRY